MKNLKAEMKRYGITASDIQKVLGCSERTVRNKLSGDSAFTCPEAFEIRDAFFKGMRLEYLFSSENNPKSA